MSGPWPVDMGYSGLKDAVREIARETQREIQARFDKFFAELNTRQVFCDQGNALFELATRLESEAARDKALYALSKRCFDFQLFDEAFRVTSEMRKLLFRNDMYMRLFRAFLDSNQTEVAFSVMQKISYQDVRSVFLCDFYKKVLVSGQPLHEVIAFDARFRQAQRDFTVKPIGHAMLFYVENLLFHGDIPNAIAVIGDILRLILAPAYSPCRMIFCEPVARALAQRDLLREVLLISREYSFFSESGYRALSKCVSKQYCAEAFKDLIQKNTFTPTEMGIILPQYAAGCVKTMTSDEVVAAVALVGTYVDIDATRDRFYISLGSPLAKAFQDDRLNGLEFCRVWEMMLSRISDPSLLTETITGHIPFQTGSDLFTIFQSMIREHPRLSDAQKSHLLEVMSQAHDD